MADDNNSNIHMMAENLYENSMMLNHTHVAQIMKLQLKLFTLKVPPGILYII